MFLLLDSVKNKDWGNRRDAKTKRKVTDKTLLLEQLQGADIIFISVRDATGLDIEVAALKKLFDRILLHSIWSRSNIKRP